MLAAGRSPPKCSVFTGGVSPLSAATTTSRDGVTLCVSATLDTRKWQLRVRGGSLGLGGPACTNQQLVFGSGAKQVWLWTVVMPCPTVAKSVSVAMPCPPVAESAALLCVLQSLMYACGGSMLCDNYTHACPPPRTMRVTGALCIFTYPKLIYSCKAYIYIYCIYIC